MPKMSKSKSAKKRTDVKDLPKKERKVSKDELSKVKGGVDGADFLAWQRQLGTKVAGNNIAVDPSDPSGNT